VSFKLEDRHEITRKAIGSFNQEPADGSWSNHMQVQPGSLHTVPG